MWVASIIRLATPGCRRSPPPCLWSRLPRHDPALRLPAFDRAGLPRRRAGDPAGLCLSVHGDGLEVGSAGKGNRHDPRAADTRGGLLIGAVLVKSVSLACANFSGSFDLNQRDLPCMTIFCDVPGG